MPTVGKAKCSSGSPRAERRLTEQQHGAGVFVAGGDLADRCERRRVRRPFAELGEPAGNEVALADGVEDLDRAYDVQLGQGARRSEGGSGGGRTMSLSPSRARASWP